MMGLGDWILTSALSRERILVVEDERKISDAIAAGLRAADYEVITAPSGEDAFFLLHNQTPNLMVLDLGLPRRSGMELLTQVRSMNNPIPILILTSNSSLNDRVAALDAGADDFLLKPFLFFGTLRPCAGSLTPRSLSHCFRAGLYPAARRPRGESRYSWRLALRDKARIDDAGI